MDLLQALVSIPSPSGHEAEASHWLTTWMGEHGFDASVDEAGNSVGSRGHGARQILLLGHIDTFPGQLPVRRDGEWLTGRGTVDAKGSLCAFVAAVASADVQPGWQLTVVGAVEEETTSSRGARHLLAQAVAPECCVIGEPSGWQRITLGYKGRLLADLQWRAPLSHSAGPDRLPAEQAVDIWNAVVSHCTRFNVERATSFDRLDPSLRRIVTQDQDAFCAVEMTIGFRVPPDLHPTTLAEDVQHIVHSTRPDTPASQDNAVAGDCRDQVCLDFSGHETAFRTDKNNPLVRAFLSGIRLAGGQPRFVLKTGTSDMNVVGPAWCVPIVAYGPGDSALDHTPHERINLREFQRSIEVLRNVLDNLQRSDP